MRSVITGLVCGLAFTAASVAAGAPNAQAAPAKDSAVVIQSVRGTVHGGQEIWTRVDPFSGFVGFTFQSEGILATCKRWGADQRWWYWVKFDLDDKKGHVPGEQTNITHSHLDRCS